MRTTVELAPDLLRLAKSRSAERGESLKSLLTRAVAAEVGQAAPDARPRPRMTLPLFGDPSGPMVRLTNDVLAARQADADAAALAHSATSASPRRRRRDASRR